jgi:hypothetical protein
MFKNPPFCKLELPVVIASILSACGSSNSNENPSIEAKVDELDRFLLCHDSNLDGQCVTKENTKSFKTLALALAGLATEGRGPVIING